MRKQVDRCAGNGSEAVGTVSLLSNRVNPPAGGFCQVSWLHGEENENQPPQKDQEPGGVRLSLALCCHCHHGLK